MKRQRGLALGAAVAAVIGTSALAAPTFAETLPATEENAVEEPGTTPTDDDPTDDTDDVSPPGDDTGTGTEDPVDEGMSDPPEDGTSDPTDEGTEEPTEDVTEEPTEDPTDDVTEDPTEEPVVYEPVLTVDPASIEVYDFVTSGAVLAFSLSGCEPGLDYYTSWEMSEGMTVEFSGASDAEGNVTDTVMGSQVPLPESLIGTNTVNAMCGDENMSATFEVTPGEGDPEPPYEPGGDADLSLSTDTISAVDFADPDTGVVATMTGCEPGSDVEFTADVGQEQPFHVFEVADDEGTASTMVYGFKPPDDTTADEVGVKVVAMCGEEADTAYFTIVASVFNPSLSISAEKILVSRFLAPELGVILSLDDCEPSTIADFRVVPAEGTETAWWDTPITDEIGHVDFRIYGEESDHPETYIGTWNVFASCSGENFTGSFEVVAGDALDDGKDDDGTSDGNDGDSDDGTSDGTDDGNDDGSTTSGEDTTGTDASEDGSDLPRTGAELTGLAIGLVLLVIGGVALVVGRQRSRK